MRKFCKILTTLLISLTLLGVPAAVSATELTGWLPYWDSQNSVNSVLVNKNQFKTVSPFWHSTTNTSSGVKITTHSLNWSTRNQIRETLQTSGVKILPSITDGTGKNKMAATLADVNKRNVLINDIVNLVNSNQYDGVDLDFETFAFTDIQTTWATTQNHWVAFIITLSAQLKSFNKLLSVAVPPQFGAKSGYWVYDYKRIAPYIDRLAIMAYDYSWSTAGPVGGPYSWVERILTYAKTVVPAHKIYLGTPAYGRDWVTGMKGTNCVKSSTKTITIRASTLGGQWQRDSASGELFNTYKVKEGNCTVTRQRWMPDATTIATRRAMASAAGVAGVAMWYLGSEKPGTYGKSVKRKISATGKKVKKKLKVTGKLPVLKKSKIVLKKKEKNRWVTVKTVKMNKGLKFKIVVKYRKGTYRVISSNFGKVTLQMR